MPDEETSGDGAPDAAEERRMRFGSLPERVRPSEHVESVATDPPRGVPESAMDEREWPLRWAAGG